MNNTFSAKKRLIATEELGKDPIVAELEAALTALETDLKTVQENTVFILDRIDKARKNLANPDRMKRMDRSTLSKSLEDTLSFGYTYFNKSASSAIRNSKKIFETTEQKVEQHLNS